jgi:hypothetical protein
VRAVPPARVFFASTERVQRLPTRSIVSVITDPVVVDAILRHVDAGGGHDPHAPRSPPAA